MGPELHALQDMDYRGELHARTVAAVVAVGDRDWALVPRPCIGLEGALGPVWRAAPGELPQLVERLTPDALERVRTALRVLRLRTPLPPHLLMPVLARAYDFTIDDDAEFEMPTDDDAEFDDTTDDDEF